jgi:predicted DNA-binding transcriptional regulator AlpA
LLSLSQLDDPFLPPWRAESAQNMEVGMQTIQPQVTERAVPAARSKKLLPTRAVMARYDVSDRTIDRWVADPTLNFPRPIRINRKRFFFEHELDAFDAGRR